MLVLARRKNEAVILDYNGVVITIRVVGNEAGKVKLGFAAPPEVNIRREEVPDNRKLPVHEEER